MATEAPAPQPNAQNSPITLSQVISFLLDKNNAEQIAGNSALKPKTDVSQATPDQVAAAKATANGPVIPVQNPNNATKKATLPDVFDAMGIHLKGLLGEADSSEGTTASAPQSDGKSKEKGGASKAIDAISGGSLDGTKLGSVISAVTKLAEFL